MRVMKKSEHERDNRFVTRFLESPVICGIQRVNNADGFKQNMLLYEETNELRRGK